MVTLELPETVLRSSFHRGFFERGLRDIEYKDLQIVKSYSRKSPFLRSYGFKLDNVKHHCRYTFDDLGLPTYFTIFNRGEIEFERPVNFYRNHFNAYDVLIAVANVISGIYKLPVNELYFESFVDHYLGDEPEKFFEFLKKEWNIALDPTAGYEDFEELVGVIVLHLKRGEIKDPRKQMEEDSVAGDQ